MLKAALFGLCQDKKIDLTLPPEFLSEPSLLSHTPQQTPKPHQDGFSDLSVIQRKDTTTNLSKLSLDSTPTPLEKKESKEVPTDDTTIEEGILSQRDETRRSSQIELKYARLIEELEKDNLKEDTFNVI